MGGIMKVLWRAIMKGVSYITDAKGHKKAVVIDLKKHAELWEDFHDALEVEARRNDPTIPIEEAEKRLRRNKKLG